MLPLLQTIVESCDQRRFMSMVKQDVMEHTSPSSPCQFAAVWNLVFGYGREASWLSVGFITEYDVVLLCSP
jgi:hypothetical protein